MAKPLSTAGRIGWGGGLLSHHCLAVEPVADISNEFPASQRDYWGIRAIAANGIGEGQAGGFCLPTVQCDPFGPKPARNTATDSAKREAGFFLNPPQDRWGAS
jgi:hypothetical protein